MITNIIQFLHTTAAYQTAALHLMAGEASFTAKNLDLLEMFPAMTSQWVSSEVTPPPLGVGGYIVTSNYWFDFENGHLRRVQKLDWLKKISPTATNLLFLANRPSLLDTNSAYQLATRWLAALSVDVTAMQQRFPPHIFQVPARKTDASGRMLRGVSNNVATPLFDVSWGNRKSPTDFMNPVRVKILGTTKELLELDIQDVSVFQRLALTVTNTSELLGPLPPPRHFIEELVGGKDAYETIVNPERVEAWLLKSVAEDKSQQNTPRTKTSRLASDSAKKFAQALLDFNSYAWRIRKSCLPDYGAQLRFTRGQDSVEFRLCYECDILQVIHNGRAHRENFDYGHNQLVIALQAVFPRDRRVKKLEFNHAKCEDLLKVFQQQ